MMNSPQETAESYVAIGTAKTRLPISKMLVMGILAGLFIAFGGVASTAAAATVENASLAKLVSAVVFPGGLAMVLIAGSELFTGNCLLVIPLLTGDAPAGGVLKSWVFVYIGNLIGGLLAAVLVVFGHVGSLFGGAMAASMVSTAAAKAALSFPDALLRGVLCNILVCVAVWMSLAAKSVGGKIAGLFFPIMLFVVCGFEHCVANMYFIPAGILASGVHGIETAGLTWGSFFLHNLLPVTLGNLIGGAAVGCAYWFIYLKKK